MNRIVRVVLSASFALACVAGLLAACSSPAEPEPEAALPTTGAPPAPPKPWHDMSHEEHTSWMKRAVLPRMKAAFAAADAEEFAKMNCATCHGAGVKNRTYEMPNPDLPKLPSTPEGFKKLQEEEPAMMKFMKETVVPQMAAMIGEEQYDPATQSGFGCFECHTKE